MKIEDGRDDSGFIRTVTFPDGEVLKYAINDTLCADKLPAETMKALADEWLDDQLAKRK